MYAMVDFICIGLLELQVAKNETPCPQRANSRHLNHKATVVIIRLSDLIYHRQFQT